MITSLEKMKATFWNAVGQRPSLQIDGALVEIVRQHIKPMLMEAWAAGTVRGGETNIIAFRTGKCQTVSETYKECEAYADRAIAALNPEETSDA